LTSFKLRSSIHHPTRRNSFKRRKNAGSGGVLAAVDVEGRAFGGRSAAAPNPSTITHHE
jgi:hypothetical protein